MFGADLAQLSEFVSIGSTHMVLPCVIAVPTAMLLTVLRPWRQRHRSVLFARPLPSSFLGGRAHSHFHGGRFPVSLMSVIGEISRENLVLPSHLGKIRWSGQGHCHDPCPSQVRRVCVEVLCSWLRSAVSLFLLFLDVWTFVRETVWSCCLFL